MRWNRLATGGSTAMLIFPCCSDTYGAKALYFKGCHSFLAVTVDRPTAGASFYPGNTKPAWRKTEVSIPTGSPLPSVFRTVPGAVPGNLPYKEKRPGFLRTSSETRRICGPELKKCRPRLPHFHSTIISQFLTHWGTSFIHDSQNTWQPDS